MRRSPIGSRAASGRRLPSRRTVLAGLLGTAAGTSLGLPPFRVRTAHAQPATVDVLQLSNDLHVLTVGGTNALALTGVEGVVLVDGARAHHSGALLEAVAKLPR